MLILDGKIASGAIKESLKKEVDKLTDSGKRSPHLAAILAGNNGASETYVASKVKQCAEIGFRSTLIRLEDTINEETLLNEITKLNDDDEVDGILVQLPLPKHIKEQKVIEAITPAKDVDGFHPLNVGLLASGSPGLIPCTPAGVMKLLSATGVMLEGARAVVLGRSAIVGPCVMHVLLGRSVDRVSGRAR